MQKIRIYADDGSSVACVQETRRSLEELFTDSCDIELICADEIRGKSWRNETGLLIIPGGRSNPYHEKLGSRGMQSIKDFVETGGHYLGICAGAYFACRRTEFEVGTELEITRDDGLGLFPGRATGSAYSDQAFRYGTEQNSRLAEVELRSRQESFYFNGGCFFTVDSFEHRHQVLGRFADISGNPACIVLCQYGRGRVLLSGVHFEYSYRGLDTEDEWNKKIFRRLSDLEQQRVNNFQYLVRDCLLSAEAGVN